MIANLRERLAWRTANDYISPTTGLKQRSLHGGRPKIAMNYDGSGKVLLERRTGIRIDVRSRKRYETLLPESFCNAAGTSKQVDYGRADDCMHDQ